MKNILIIVVFFAFAVSINYAQPLDWSSDVTVYGSPDDEHFPQIANIQNSNSFRAFCIKNDSTISTRTSNEGGATWGNYDDFEVAYSKPRLESVSDVNYQYVFSYGINYSEKKLYRFDENSGGWLSSFLTEIAEEDNDLVQSAEINTDYTFEPIDNYINVLWTEYNPVSHIYQGVFAQSRNHGQSFLQSDTVFQSALPESNKEIAMTICGDSEWSKIVIAAPLERAGSIPQEIKLYSSIDEGESWTSGLTIDSSSEIQQSPTLYANGSLVLLAYLRKTNQNARGDIYYTYSPDSGNTFAPLTALTQTNLAETAPRLIIRDENFYLFYMAGIGELGGVYVRQGSVDSPWQLSDTIRISNDYNAVLSAGLSVTSSSEGVCVVWTEEFELGDQDILFDASWRSNSLEDIPAIPSQNKLSCFPNPFNNTTTLKFSLNHTAFMSFDIIDMLGRNVAELKPNTYTAGVHQIPLDLSTFASGTYFLQSTNSEFGKTKLILLK